MDLILFDLSSNNTKRAMRRFKNRGGKINWYQPRPDLLQRWKNETGLSEKEVLKQLSKERRFLVKRDYGVDFPF